MTEILKADGSVEQFDGSKLEASLRRSGASLATAERIRKELEEMLVERMTTHEIYRHAFSLLRKEERTAAARYSLRRAVFDLGPTGHPFEDFVAELFKKEGWNVEWRKLVPGKCVMHELDIYATRGNEHLAAELKYHNDPNYKTDVKVALYVKARFDDIWQCDPAVANVCPIDRGFLITNTKFTETAIQYAHCAGIELIGWSYPTEGNLYDRIIAASVYPVTALTTLQRAEKRLLINSGIVTTSQLQEKREMIREIAKSEKRAQAILEEIETLSSKIR